MLRKAHPLGSLAVILSQNSSFNINNSGYKASMNPDLVEISIYAVGDPVMVTMTLQFSGFPQEVGHHSADQKRYPLPAILEDY